MAYVLMDVGGTQIKALACEGPALPREKIRTFDARSNFPKDEIFQNFSDIIAALLSGLPEGKKGLQGVGMAFPGPFDYQKGISYMQGIGKYDSIYGCSVREEIKKRLPRQITEKVRFTFLHDVEAFAVGEMRFGAAADSRRAVCVCIGTGAGSAFTENGRVLRRPADGVPENGWIYRFPFRDGILDDYVSARGLKRISRRFFDPVPDGAELSSLCDRGDPRAFAAFEEFGKVLSEALAPFLKSFHPDTLVLGGQISKSYRRFGKALDDLCERLRIRVKVSPDTSGSILKGLLCAAGSPAFGAGAI